jgi:hypothetical protein
MFGVDDSSKLECRVCWAGQARGLWRLVGADHDLQVEEQLHVDHNA